MAEPGYLIGPDFLGRIRRTVDAAEGTPYRMGTSRIPTRFEGEDGGSTGKPAAALRLGQFSGQWPNEPGPTGSGNVKVVTLYKMRTPQNNPNDYVPELDGDGDPVTAVVLNLFSHIPTQTAGDMPLWCLVMPFAGAGKYVSGYSFNPDTNNYDIPIYTDYSTLWLLVAAEC